MLAAHCYDMYAKAGEEFLGGPFCLDSVQKKLARWEAQIDSSVQVDPNGPGHVLWQEKLGKLRGNIPYFRESFEKKIHP
jgi:hypothetical protein